jgi:hypothetical protein
MKYNKIVIGIDQSYTKSGISVAADGELIKVKSINYKGLKSRSQKRKHMAMVLQGLLKQTSKKGLQTLVICERIRTFSNNGQKRSKFGKGEAQGLNPGYLKMTGALIATIVDTAADYNVDVYSVDTRSWKSKVVGSSKAKKKNGKRDAKGETVEFIQKKGFDLFIRTNKNGVDIYDDDAADSACMALYGFIPDKQQKLLLEE